MAFKPNCNLLPLYAYLSREWCNPLPFSHLGIEHSFTLGHEQQANCFACLTYTFREVDIQFFIPNTGLCFFLDSNLEAIDINDFSEELKPILISTLQANLVSIFAQWQLTLTPKSVDLWPEERPCTNLVQGIISRENTPIYSIYINANDLPSNVLEPLFKTTTFANQGEGLTFPFTLERAQTQLLLRDVQELNLGDVLLVRDSQTYYKFRWKNFAFQADCQDQIITVKSLIMMDENNDLPAGIIPEEVSSQAEVEEEPNQVEENVDEASDGAVSGKDILQTMPVNITFVAGEQTLSLDQVRQLHEGYTFELGKTPSDTLQILANGRCIGEGEWVQINEYLGVRITQLNLK